MDKKQFLADINNHNSEIPQISGVKLLPQSIQRVFREYYSIIKGEIDNINGIDISGKYRFHKQF